MSNLSNATVAQLMIPVDDFDRGVAFYRDVLGIGGPRLGDLMAEIPVA